MPAEQEPNVISDLIDANNDLAVSAVQAISQLQAELLAAQEQLAVLNKHGGLAAEERDALQADLQAAQEREKALREIGRQIILGERTKNYSLLAGNLLLLEQALAASPSEKPGGEDYPKRHPNEAVEAAGRRAYRYLGRIERQEREEASEKPDSEWEPPSEDMGDAD